MIDLLKGILKDFCNKCEIATWQEICPNCGEPTVPFQGQERASNEAINGQSLVAVKIKIDTPDGVKCILYNLGGMENHMRLIVQSF